MSADVAAGAPVNRAPLTMEHWEVVAERQEKPDWNESGYEGAEAVNEVVAGGAAAVAAEDAEGTTRLEPVKDKAAARFVVNRGTGLAHKLSPDWSPAHPMRGWKAGCGWAFTTGDSLLLATPPGRPWCSKPGCFKGAPAPADDDSSGG